MFSTCLSLSSSGALLNSNAPLFVSGADSNFRPIWSFLLVMARTPPPSRSRSRLRSFTLMWKIGALSARSALLAVLMLAALSPALVSRDWRFDLIASLLAQVTLAALVLGLWQAAFQRWIWAALFLIAATTSGSWMLRAPRADRTTEATAREGHHALRILTMNVHSHNRSTEPILALIAESDADIVVMVESSWFLMKALTDSEPIRQRYPHRFGLESRNYGQIMVLSRYPGSDRFGTEATPDLENHWGFRAGFLDINGTPLRFAAVHAPSPRTETTWGYGKATFNRLATHFDRKGSAVGEGGIQTVLVGDLNCTPTNARTNHVHDTLGLNRAKPLGVWDGTFPSNLPWFARSSIDGAFVSDGVLITNWQTVEIPGSDHLGVVLQISFPSAKGSGVVGKD